MRLILPSWTEQAAGVLFFLSLDYYYYSFADCWSNFVQVNTCLIDGNCYDDGDLNPENPFEFCNATSNTTAWAEIITTTTTTITTTSTVRSTHAPSESLFF